MLTIKKYYDFNDVLIKPSLSEIDSRQLIDMTLNLDLSITAALSRDYLDGWKPIPILSANMDTITGVDLAFELVKKNWIAVLHKYVSISEITALFDKIDLYNRTIEKDHIDYRNIFISRGTSSEDQIKLQERLESESRIKSVCIDVANGHRKSVLTYVDNLRKNLCKDKVLMVGNIASSEMFKMYQDINIDLIKVGIGPGSACTTRIKTGVGVPQISLIDECRAVATSSLVVSDGGCKVSGDISKAFVAGAHFVMIGGMLAGTRETPGEMETIDGRTVKRFSGMAAKESQQNGVPTYGVEEGKTVFIPYRGKVSHILSDIEGGVRSTCTYTGALSISKLFQAELILTNVQENKIFSS